MDYSPEIKKLYLGLRQPQAESLKILEKLADILELKKDTDVVGELEKVKALYPTCASFERDFPSVCFALATGVGKTRLMGAFISYLYIAKGIKNFFVLAPNLTIYEKLKAEFSEPNHSKYVFKGISEFVANPPRVVTGDNYGEARQSSLFKESVKINVFNISKINSEVRGGKEPRIKRLSEYLGESYFNYLSELPDLVLLMDESHHYRAAAGMKAINELKPILGLELTATPKWFGRGNTDNKFKNVVYEYSLSMALKDPQGYVKEPSVATRRNFNASQYASNSPELDLLKLEDGIRLHEDTKVALDIYSRDTRSRLVRPFVLVVTKDTTHAGKIKELIESDRFFGGRYKGKVIEIRSKLSKEESDDNIAKLLDLEKAENQIEIVIHVSMLKEGWDVANLYTIIPLKASNSEILVEQTIGRGLRLPYGRRTGNEKVDRLTIVAHDRFEAIVADANKPNSLIRLDRIIDIDKLDLPDGQEVIVSESIMDDFFTQKQQEMLHIQNEAEKEKAGFVLEAQRMIVDSANSLGGRIKNLNDLQSDETQKLVIEKMVERIENASQQNLFKAQIIDTAKKEYEAVIKELVSKIIPIPRISVQQKDEVICGFGDFDLDVSGLNYQPVSEEIIVQTLRTNKQTVLQNTGEGLERDTPAHIIMNEVINFPEVDYDRNKGQEAVLLNKLVGQAIQKISAGRSEKELKNIVIYYKQEIGTFIYSQLKEKFYLENGGFEQSLVYPFTKIEPHNFSKYTADSVHRYTETITPTNSIPSKVFGGFKKACHNLYKFDSKAEKDFATILEKDTDVLRWLRPADSQFKLYWKYNSKRYHPDFVVETADTIFMVEIKAERDIDDTEVQEKAEAGKKYCEAATTFNLANGGKQWVYVLIPHTAVALNMSFGGLCK